MIAGGGSIPGKAAGCRSEDRQGAEEAQDERHRRAEGHCHWRAGQGTQVSAAQNLPPPPLYISLSSVFAFVLPEAVDDVWKPKLNGVLRE